MVASDRRKHLHDNEFGRLFLRSDPAPAKCIRGFFLVDFSESWFNVAGAFMDLKNLKVPEFRPPIIEPPRTFSQRIAAYSPQVKAALIGAAVTVVLAIVGLWAQHLSYSKENGRLLRCRLLRMPGIGIL